ncbi:hypothetical protein P9D34_11175 [Bacillus swezeyi]|uniref:Lipoprotein n=1 Tax=Bacillus swezeyi TaxID=1925020 RepID=A0A1R1RZN7_9BACI|nr:hypothetical protein [Bacillus swezeyi]MEC1261007.1 hypothetical protein [Bacillus swezeyi]MED2928944.1 hypothetical protein [Bacillus swezeyi]MED2964466.1 hypothetical protein [Bacillus swezeyi]MED2979460.1 hypothetical protein [Bacillus swezeyi]MED3072376.1 hypothetical protein [Bacillus swezeyi]
MKQLKVLFFSLLLLTGCSMAKENNKEDKWFNSEQEAIEDGIKYENITKNDILDKINLNGKKVIVFRFSESDGKGICIAYINHKNNKYQWYRDLNYVILKSDNPNIGNLNASTEFKTPKGESYKLYIGVADKSNFKLKTDIGHKVTPNIDEKTGMYYYIMSE